MASTSEAAASAMRPDPAGRLRALFDAKRKEKRSRQVSVIAPNDSSKKAKLDHFDQLWEPLNLWCAVEIGGIVIIGDPFSLPPGWSVRISLDAGYLEQPSVGLNFRFAKDGIDFKNNDDYHTFALG